MRRRGLDRPAFRFDAYASAGRRRSWGRVGAIVATAVAVQERYARGYNEQEDSRDP